MWFLQGQRFENFRQAKPVSAQVSRDKVMQMLHLEFDSNGKLIFCDYTEYANQRKGNKSNFIIDCLKNVVPLHFKFRHVRSTILDIAGKVKGAKGIRNDEMNRVGGSWDTNGYFGARGEIKLLEELKNVCNRLVQGHDVKLSNSLMFSMVEAHISE